MTTAGIKALRKIQMGPETTSGSAVAATMIWRGPAVMAEDSQEKVMPDENIGYSSKMTRQYTPKYLTELEFPETEATFEFLPYLLSAGIATVAATTQGSGKVYVYTVPSGDTAGIKTYTIEGGDNKTVEEIEYAFVSEIKLTGKKGEAWMMSAKWFGRQGTVTSFTGALSPIAVDEMLFQKTKFYIDTTTIGSTQVPNTLLEASITIKTGWKPQHTASGNLYFDYAEFTGAEVEMDLTMLNNTTTIADRVLFRADTPRLFRFKCEGDPLTTSATTYSYKTMVFDMAGVYNEFSAPNDEDEGSAVFKAKVIGGYHTTAAKFAEFTVVNQLASLT